MWTPWYNCYQTLTAQQFSIYSPVKGSKGMCAELEGKTLLFGCSHHRTSCITNIFTQTVFVKWHIDHILVTTDSHHVEKGDSDPPMLVERYVFTLVALSSKAETESWHPNYTKDWFWSSNNKSHPVTSFPVTALLQLLTGLLEVHCLFLFLQCQHISPGSRYSAWAYHLSGEICDPFISCWVDVMNTIYLNNVSVCVGSCTNVHLC